MTKGKLAALIATYPGEYAYEDFAKYATWPFVLVEQNNKGSDFWLSLHESPEGAAEYHVNQEYAEDWSIVELVNLDTDETFTGELSVTWVPGQNRPIETQFSANSDTTAQGDGDA